LSEGEIYKDADYDDEYDSEEDDHQAQLEAAQLHEAK
jgi:hypothetical protein